MLFARVCAVIVDDLFVFVWSCVLMLLFVELCFFLKIKKNVFCVVCFLCFPPFMFLCVVLVFLLCCWCVYVVHSV